MQVAFQRRDEISPPPFSFFVNALTECSARGGWEGASVSSAATASFSYDADGMQVIGTVNGVTTYGACPEPRRRVGSHYEKTGTDVVTKYYMVGATRLAVRTGNTLKYLLGDHLGSSSVATDDLGGLDVRTLYKAWGEVRFTTADKTLPTRYTFTGQYSYVSDDATDLGAAGFGLMYFNARWLDPQLGRFAQADSIIPSQTQGTQAWDRYGFVNNNPVRYNDPTGHMMIEDDGGTENSYNQTQYDNARIANEQCKAGNRIYCSTWDNFSWENVPSAFGLHLGYNIQLGFGLEASYSKEFLWLFNWRSGQFTSFKSTEPGGYFGTPSGVSISGYGGITTVRGASDNAYIAGSSAYIGGSGSADAWGNIGVAGQRSQSLTESGGVQFIDPVSKMPVDTGQLSLKLGIGAIANGIDAGITIGEAYTQIISSFCIYDLFR